MINKQILVTSINKQINKSKIYGELDLTILYFFNLLRYYIDYTEDEAIFVEANKQLKLLIQNLKYKYPDIICNYKLIDGGTVLQNGTTPTIIPPTVSSKQVDVNGMYYYNFTLNDFLAGYNDPQNSLYNKLLILPSKLTEGKLLLNGIEKVEPFEYTIPTDIPLSSIDFKLQYVIPTGNQFNPFETRDINKEELSQLFDFKVSNKKDVFSTTKTITIINSVYQVNYPATIGDVFITADNRTETTLNLQTFTTLMSPPYSDPENDLIDAIRIDTISTSNQGTFTYNGLAVQEGDIISKADLDAGIFKHIGPNTDSLATDSLEFSARDSGSLIWVQ